MVLSKQLQKQANPNSGCLPEKLITFAGLSLFVLIDHKCELPAKVTVGNTVII